MMRAINPDGNEASRDEMPDELMEALEGCSGGHQVIQRAELGEMAGLSS